MNTTSTSLAPLERFAARSLDFPAVVAVLERFATTSLGLRALRTLEPLGDAEALEAAQRFRELTDLLRGGSPSFGGVADPRPALEHARAVGRPFSDEEIALLRDLLEAFERLKEWFASLQSHAPALAALAVGMPDLKPLRERVEKVVDERGRVRDDASPLLARLRVESRELQSRIDRELRTIIAKPEIKAVLSDLTPARRGGRAVLAVKAKSQGRVAGLVHDRSQSGESVFVEPREIVAFGNRAAEIEADERREVERVLLELTRVVLAHEESIEESAERLAKLEIASIGARYAKECGAQLSPSAPNTKGGRELVLRAARHPLLVEQKRLGRLGEVVPVDLRLGGDFDLLLITGPNTGGKTLALKSAGLAALLARCGLPFPCSDGSTVPLYDGVVADIGDEQEISQSLSTFSSHLARIKAGLARATDRTLFLLDELGGGTDPDEGAALSEALLETLLEKRSPVLASTHIGKLKEFAFRNARAENASVEFDATTLRPRYRLPIDKAPGAAPQARRSRAATLAEARCRDGRADGRRAQGSHAGRRGAQGGRDAPLRRRAHVARDRGEGGADLAQGRAARGRSAAFDRGPCARGARGARERRAAPGASSRLEPRRARRRVPPCGRGALGRRVLPAPRVVPRHAAEGELRLSAAPASARAGAARRPCEARAQGAARRHDDDRLVRRGHVVRGALSAREVFDPPA